MKLELQKRVKAYLNKTGLTQAGLCRRVGGLCRSRLARQLSHRGFYHQEDIKKITEFLDLNDLPKKD